MRIILVLFCATVASELVGKDQRNRTLSLYFSRAVSRFDYTFAKFAALTSAMLVLTLGPQLLLFIGNGMAADDLGGYARDNWDLVFPIIAGSLLVSAVIASVGLCIAAYLPRRAYSTAAIVGTFILTLCDRAHPHGVDRPRGRAVLPARQPGRLGGSDPLALPCRSGRGRTCSPTRTSAGGSTSLPSSATIAATFALTLRRFRRVST